MGVFRRRTAYAHQGNSIEYDVPLDVLVIDMDWHLDGWTGYTWNPKYFPDPDGFLKWFTSKACAPRLTFI
ncbi:MAG: glycoside hydrolase family 31 protein [Phycisphaerae bacterium]